MQSDDGTSLSVVPLHLKSERLRNLFTSFAPSVTKNLSPTLHDVTKKALITIPSLPGLSHEDLQDALEYTGLMILSTHKHIGDKVSEVSAAIAGSGYGLCEHYENADACEDEEADMPVSHILALSLSQTFFSAAYTYMQAAYRSILEKETIRYDLGLQIFQTNRSDTQEEEALYWSRMRAATVKVGRASRGVPNYAFASG